VNKFIKKWGLSGLGGLILFSLLVLSQAAVMAQSSAIEIKTLLIDLWPEYDRPETLVIYHVELAPSTGLPAQVTFQLPGYLEEMHVVAVERDGILLEVNPDTIELKKEGDNYDPLILTKQGQERQLSFDFTAADDVEKLTIQVQQPVGAEEFSMTPAPSRNFTGSDGLRYHAVEIAGLAAAETVTVRADYTLPNDVLSAQSLGSENAEHAPDLVGASVEGFPSENLTLGYTLIGVGAALLLGVGGYWWWSKRMASPSPVVRSRAQRQKRKVRAKQVKVMPQIQAASSASSIGNFCYRCGAPLREEANFCHFCGTERRKE
jgi:hypothetical protein